MRDFRITIARADGPSSEPILRHLIVSARSIRLALMASTDQIAADEQVLGICLAADKEFPHRYESYCVDCKKSGCHLSIETLDRFAAKHIGHQILFSTPTNKEEFRLFQGIREKILEDRFDPGLTKQRKRHDTVAKHIRGQSRIGKVVPIEK
jgi:hypothetical protein